MAWLQRFEQRDVRTAADVRTPNVTKQDGLKTLLLGDASSVSSCALHCLVTRLKRKEAIHFQPTPYVTQVIHTTTTRADLQDDDWLAIPESGRQSSDANKRTEGLKQLQHALTSSAVKLRSIISHAFFPCVGTHPHRTRLTHPMQLALLLQLIEPHGSMCVSSSTVHTDTSNGAHTISGIPGCNVVPATAPSAAAIDSQKRNDFMLISELGVPGNVASGNQSIVAEESLASVEVDPTGALYCHLA